MSQATLMARPKKPRPQDREPFRKPFTPVRIRGVLAEPAKEAATALAQDFSVWVNEAVRQRLAAEGRWPPPARPRG